MDDGRMDGRGVRGEKQLYWIHVDSWVNMDRKWVKNCLLCVTPIEARSQDEIILKIEHWSRARLATITSYTQPVQCVLLFLVLVGNSTLF